jgi:hypothetical protein
VPSVILSSEPHREKEREVHLRRAGDAELGALVRELERVLARRLELFHLVLLRRKGANDTDAAEVLVHDARHHR